jgi:hypothetical protein
MPTTQVSRKLPPGPAIPRKLQPVEAQRGTGTAYRGEFARTALGAMLLGGTLANLAKLFDVTFETIDNWRRAHPAFRKAIREGGEWADSKVAASLYPPTYAI